MNTLFPFVFNTSSNSQESFTEMAVNMEVNTPRGWSIFSSANSSRLALVHSNVSFKTYAEHI